MTSHNSSAPVQIENTIARPALYTLLAVCLTLMGCSSAGNENSSSNSQTSDVICQVEQETGSIRKRRVCRKREQVEADRQKSQEILDQIQRTTNVPSGGA